MDYAKQYQVQEDLKGVADQLSDTSSDLHGDPNPAVRQASLLLELASAQVAGAYSLVYNADAEVPDYE
jgi:hypothetical protein